MVQFYLNMNIDLTRFVQEKTVIAPLVAGWGKREGRTFNFPNKENGWYKLKFGNDVQIVGSATPLETFKCLKKLKTYLAYAYGEEGIAYNFDVFKRLGLGQSVRVEFLNLPIYSIAKIAQEEDGRYYFVEEGRRDSVLEALRSVRSGLGAKLRGGITPELGYYHLLVELTSQAFREVDRLNKLVLNEDEKERRVKQFANTLEGRLKKIIEDSGGEFIDYKKSRGKNIVVTWKVGGQLVKSQIDSGTLSIVSAGFCLSGADKEHTMNSIVRLAKDFQEDKPLYITRE